jgi:hypothetical protein
MKSQAGSSGSHPTTADPNSGCAPAREMEHFMQCANPSCSKDLLYFLEERLQLVELEPASDDQLQPDDGAFTMRPLPGKLFWLCSDCANTHSIKRWTAAGLVLASRKRHRRDRRHTHETAQAPPQMCMSQSGSPHSTILNALPDGPIHRFCFTSQMATCREPHSLWSHRVPLHRGL